MSQPSFIRSLRSLIKPKGIALAPRPAEAIAHVGRPRVPDHLAGGGQVDDDVPDLPSWKSASMWGPVALTAMGGLAGALDRKYGKGPKLNIEKNQNNPYAVPMIQRGTDPLSKAVTQHVIGYRPSAGSVTPNAQGYSAGANYTPDGSGPFQFMPQSPDLMFAKGGMVCGYDAGGQVQQPEPDDPQVQQIFIQAVAALQGKIPNAQAALLAFVKVFGPEALEELKQNISGGPGIQQGQQPMAQPQGITGAKAGGLLQGPGDGMSDSIPAQHAQTGTPLALSTGEYVVPASDVAMLGNGSTDAGAKALESGIARLRKQKYGHSKQPPRTKGNPILNG